MTRWTHICVSKSCRTCLKVQKSRFVTMRNMLIQRSLHQRHLKSFLKMNRMPLTLKRQNNQELFLNWLALQCFPSLCCSERADDTAPSFHIRFYYTYLKRISIKHRNYFNVCIFQL